MGTVFPHIRPVGTYYFSCMVLGYKSVPGAGIAVKFGSKELFGLPKIVPWCQKFLILMKSMANWSQEMVPYYQFVPYQTFLIAKFDCIRNGGIPYFLK